MAGLLFIPRAGIQTDEALFSAPLYEPAYTYGAVEIFGHKIPLLLMNYLGALKTWIYWLVFKMFEPTVWSTRVPMLLAATATLWLFWGLARRLAGERAALIGAALLATDATFLLTAVCDWGPVALQHLFLVSALVLALRFHDTGSPLALSTAFLVLGLAVWDKALFLWLLGGLGIAVLVVLPRELRRASSWKNLLLAGAAFCLGAAPLLYYNVRSRGETVRENAVLTWTEMPKKAASLQSALSGSSLFGYLVGEASDEPPRRVTSALGRLSVSVSELAGEPRSSLQPHLILLALLLVPPLWRTRARRSALFCLVFLVVAWLQMALTARAGGSAHHVVLLWPMPHLLAAVVFAELSRKLRAAGLVAAVTLTGLAAGSNLLLLNQNYSQLLRFGASAVWSDAIPTLAARLEKLGADHIFIMDWGLMDNVRMLTAGRLPIHVGSDAVTSDSPAEAERSLFRRMVEMPNSVFVSFTDRWEQTPGLNRRIAARAADIGFRVGPVELVHDRNGRPIFQVIRIIQSPTI